MSKSFDESYLEFSLLYHVIRLFRCDGGRIEDSYLPVLLLYYAHEFIVELGLLVGNQTVELFIFGVEETDTVLLACEAVRESVEVVAW